MITVAVPRQSTAYPIIAVTGLFAQLDTFLDIKPYSSIFIITDSNVAPLYAQQLQDRLASMDGTKKVTCFVFPAGEQHKTLATCMDAYRAMVVAGIDRKALVITLGGGVTTDMGGFIASTFKRGLRFVNISTSVLGMVDASVGGKLGVDFEGYKNYVGVFNNPQMVLMDIDHLSTLPTREFTSGFGEIIKHGVIADRAYFSLVTSKIPSAFTREELTQCIVTSNVIKANVVEQDEREGGIRKILNFGHTIGHALETWSFSTDIPLAHGEAVALGMVAEARISEALGMIDASEVALLVNGISQTGLPVSLPSFPSEIILKLMLGDKKSEEGTIQWTLLEAIGKAVWDINVPDNIVEQSLLSLLN